MRTKDMVLTALFAAVLCVVAPFSISVGPIPLTLATLVIYLSAGALGWKRGVLAVIIYVLIGAAGLPVFSNFEGGFYKIAGLTGGFIAGYIPCALVAGFIIDGFKRKLWAYVLGMAIGTVMLYTCGVLWFMLQTGSSLPASLALCVTPFLIGDALKIVAACVIAPRLYAALMINN